jgi:hypothetical protein
MEVESSLFSLPTENTSDSVNEEEEEIPSFDEPLYQAETRFKELADSVPESEMTNFIRYVEQQLVSLFNVSIYGK